MAAYFDAIETRIAAILYGGRGADGSLGSDATARSIPAGRFRWSQDGVSQRDPAIPAAERDRAYSIDWESISDSDDSNELDGEAIRWARFTLLVSYAEGTSLAEYAHTAGAEVAATVVSNARKRALSDAERIRRALCFPALYGSDTSPVIVGIDREGASTVERLTEGVLLCATTYRLILAVPMGTTFDP